MAGKEEEPGGFHRKGLVSLQEDPQSWRLVVGTVQQCMESVPLNYALEHGW